MHDRFRVLSVVGALVVSLVAGGSAFAQNQQNQKGGAKIDKAQQAERDAADKIVDDALKGLPAPTAYKFTFTGHPMKGRDAKTFMPFILAFDKGQALPAAAICYLRVVSKDDLAKAQKAIAEHEMEVQKAASAARLNPDDASLAEEEERVRAEVPKADYSFENFRAINLATAKAEAAFMLPWALAVAPGQYDVYVLVKEPVAGLKNKKIPAKAGLLKIGLNVPSFATDELTTSSVMLSRMVQQLKTAPTAEDVARNPYIFGAMMMLPSLDFKFTKGDELNILFYVYNAGLDKTTGKPDLAIDYNFYQKADGADKFFNKAPTLALNATTLPANFDVKAGHQLSNGLQGFPLGTFPEGEYRLEIKILDKVTGKSKTENVRFTVTP
jgi:hypothetical protein